jgi:hypothetical protein
VKLFALTTGDSKLPLRIKLARAAGTMTEVKEPTASNKPANDLHRIDKGFFIYFSFRFSVNGFQA